MDPRIRELLLFPGIWALSLSERNATKRFQVMYGVRQLDEGVAKMPEKRRSSRTRKVPTYLQHRPSGRAYCWVYDDEGSRKARNNAGLTATE